LTCLGAIYSAWQRHLVGLIPHGRRCGAKALIVI